MSNAGRCIGYRRHISTEEHGWLALLAAVLKLAMQDARSGDRREREDALQFLASPAGRALAELFKHRSKS